MQTDLNVRLDALKKMTMETMSSLTAQFTRDEVREFLFLFGVAVAVCYIWCKEFGVLLFIGTFLIFVTLVRIRNLKNEEI